MHLKYMVDLSCIQKLIRRNSPQGANRPKAPTSRRNSRSVSSSGTITTSSATSRPSSCGKAGCTWSTFWRKTKSLTFRSQTMRSILTWSWFMKRARRSYSSPVSAQTAQTVLPQKAFLCSSWHRSPSLLLDAKNGVEGEWVKSTFFLWKSQRGFWLILPWFPAKSTTWRPRLITCVLSTKTNWWSSTRTLWSCLLQAKYFSWILTWQGKKALTEPDSGTSTKYAPYTKTSRKTDGPTK